MTTDNSKPVKLPRVSPSIAVRLLDYCDGEIKYWREWEGVDQAAPLRKREFETLKAELEAAIAEAK